MKIEFTHKSQNDEDFRKVMKSRYEQFLKIPTPLWIYEFPRTASSPELTLINSYEKKNGDLHVIITVMAHGVDYSHWYCMLKTIDNYIYPDYTNADYSSWLNRDSVISNEFPKEAAYIQEPLIRAIFTNFESGGFSIPYYSRGKNE